MVTSCGEAALLARANCTDTSVDGFAAHTSHRVSSQTETYRSTHPSQPTLDSSNLASPRTPGVVTSCGEAALLARANCTDTSVNGFSANMSQRVSLQTETHQSTYHLPSSAPFKEVWAACFITNACFITLPKATALPPVRLLGAFGLIPTHPLRP